MEKGFQKLLIWPSLGTDKNHKLSRHVPEYVRPLVMTYIFLYIISFRSSYETLEFTTSACLKLLDICLKDLTLRSEQLEVICVVIKLLLTSIQRQRKQMARSPSDQEYQAKEGKVISQLLEFLKAKLGGELSAKMACYNESKVLLTELQVYMK